MSRQEDSKAVGMVLYHVGVVPGLVTTGRETTQDSIAAWLKKWIGLILAIVLPIAGATWGIAMAIGDVRTEIANVRTEIGGEIGEVGERLATLETQMNLLLQGLNISVEVGLLRDSATSDGS